MKNAEFLEIQQNLLSIFHPRLARTLPRIEQDNVFFAHYTTAEAAMNILRSREVWLRKTCYMSDYTEVRHGIDCLFKACRGRVGELLAATLNRLGDGIAQEATELFDGWRPYLEYDTYIACLSEHSNDDDAHGRLSMWRAFSESTGVALVLRNAPFLAYTGPPGVSSSPVAYLDVVSFEVEMQSILERIASEEDFLRNQSRETVAYAAFNMFRFAALCTKHKGFEEEKEWRIIHTPAKEFSPHSQKTIVSVNGTPQLIYKFRLQELPEVGNFGIEIPDLLDRIIIGPTKYPFAMREAFTMLLGELGVENPASHVQVSEIPLRF